MQILAMLLLLFVLVPFLELVLLLWVADVTSWQTAVLTVLGTGIGGAFLARWQGAGVYRQLQAQLASGELPGKTLVDGLLILLAGALLITPGIITDSIGFLLLFPPTRAAFRYLLMQYFRRRMEAGYVRFTFGSSPGREDVIDADATFVGEHDVEDEGDTDWP